jgi:lysozyme
MRAMPDGRCQAYQCVIGRKNGQPIYDGKWTIGWGCTEGIHQGMIWSRDEAEAALRAELSRFEAAVNRLVDDDINQNQFDALVSFAYNCGEGALAKSSILRKLNAGDMQGAADAFSLYNKSRGIIVKGLVRRRAAEKALFLEPLASPVEPDMPQTVDEPSKADLHLSENASLLDSSWAYKLNKWNLNGLKAAAVGVLAFVKDNPLEIALGILAAVILFELVQFAQRKSAIGGRA